MARLDDPTLRVDRPRPEFQAANPEVFARAQGDPDTTRRLGVIERRATELKQQFREHFERNEEIWVVREATALTAKRNFPTLQHPRPRFTPQNDFAELMMGQARRNVHARALWRMSEINMTKARMQNTILRSAPAQDQRQPSNDATPTQKFNNTQQRQRQ